MISSVIQSQVHVGLRSLIRNQVIFFLQPMDGSCLVFWSCMFLFRFLFLWVRKLFFGMIQPYFAKMTISWAIVWVQKQHQVKSHRTVFTASNKKEPPCGYGRKLGEGNITRRTHDSQVGSGSLVIDPSSFKRTLFLEGCVLLIKSLAYKDLDFGTSWSSVIMPISVGYVWLADP